MASSPKIKTLGKRLLSAAPSGAEAYVHLFVLKDSSSQEVWRSGASVGPEGKRLLEICTKRRRSVLIHDGTKDNLLRGLESTGLRSALAVPVLKPDRSLLGTVLLASPQVGAFTKEHRFSVERLAREFITPLAGIQHAPATKQESELEESDYYRSPIVITIFLIAVFLLVLWIVAPPKSKIRTEDSVPVVVVQNEAKDAADLILKGFKEANYEDTWYKFHDKLKSKWAPGRFSSQAQNWANSENNQEFLAKQTIVRVNRQRRKAKVYFSQSGTLDDIGPWVWELEREKTRWSLIRMDGPLESPKIP